MKYKLRFATLEEKKLMIERLKYNTSIRGERFALSGAAEIKVIAYEIENSPLIILSYIDIQKRKTDASFAVTKYQFELNTLKNTIIQLDDFSIIDTKPSYFKIILHS
jgi:hypothetical protein